MSFAPLGVIEAEESQCTYRCVVLPDVRRQRHRDGDSRSQCTYRCVVLPDTEDETITKEVTVVSMHLQVRGAS